MGKFTIEKWRCDRCGVVHDKRPSLPKGSPIYTIKATVEYDFVGGPEITWLDMCASCNDEVGKVITAMKKAAKETPL